MTEGALAHCRRRLDAIHLLLLDASFDQALPPTARERMGQMAGNVTLQIDMLERQDYYEHKPTAVAAAVETAVIKRRPAESKCVDGFGNHSWQGSKICQRCGAVRR